MLEKKIKYVDYNGTEREETFHFNLNRAEVVEMELGDSLSDFLKKIVETVDRKALMGMFKEFILKAYGVKSLDGKRFEKSDELRLAFSQTEAYVELYMELCSNSESASLFVNSVIPSIEPANN